MNYRTKFKLRVFAVALIPITIGIVLLGNPKLVLGILFLIWAENISELEPKLKE